MCADYYVMCATVCTEINLNRLDITNRWNKFKVQYKSRIRTNRLNYFGFWNVGKNIVKIKYDKISLLWYFLLALTMLVSIPLCYLFNHLFLQISKNNAQYASMLEATQRYIARVLSTINWNDCCLGNLVGLCVWPNITNEYDLSKFNPGSNHSDIASHRNRFEWCN